MGTGARGARTYALAVSWSLLGLIDLICAVSIATKSGIYSGVSSFLGAGTIVLPIAMVMQTIIFLLLVTPGISRYMTKKSA